MKHDTEWNEVKQAQKNTVKFDVLYNRYYQSIWRFVRKMVSSDDVCDDLTSLTFTKALEKIAQFQWQGISFKSWIYRIARNTVYDYYRSARVRTSRSMGEEEEEGLSDDSSLERDILHDEREIMLFEVIASLQQKDQYLLYYRYFEGLSVEDIATTVDMSCANVATRLHRIRKLMEKRMKNTGISLAAEPSKKD